MSKIQETAPDAIYLNIGGDTDDDLDFDLDAEVTWCHEPVFDNDIKYIKQPKLSIPKKIADKLDEFYTLKFFDLGEADHWLQENDITSWKCETDSKTRFALVDAYLASKALGVELVEVTDE